MDCKIISSLTKDDISASFAAWKKEQKEAALKRTMKFKKRRYRKKITMLRSKNASEVEPVSKVQALSEDFLNELTTNESSGGKNKTQKRNENTTIVSKKKNKKKLRITSSLIDNADFIPLDVNVSSTNFKIARLDKDTSTSMTQTALQFYNRRRNGKYIDRVPTKTLFIDGEKIEAKRNIGVKYK